MVLFALAGALLFGVLRWPAWSIALLIAGFILTSLGLGHGWNIDAMRPLDNPIFVDLALKLLVIYSVACAIGYCIGRLIALGWHVFRNR